MDNENHDFIPADDEQETLENRVIRFDINDKRIAEAKEEFKDVDAYKDLPAAKKAKTALTKMRTALGAAHTDAKAEALAYGRRCDAEKNRLLVLIGEIEDPIKKDIEDIKNKAAIAEEKRQTEITGRIDIIEAHARDRHDLDLTNLNIRLDSLLVLEMTEEIYQERLEEAEGVKDVSESRLRIAIMSEESRLEDVKKQEAQAEENRQLKEKLAKAEADQKERDDTAAAAQKIIDDAAAAEQKVKDDARQKELDDQAEEQRKAQKIIDDENQRISDEQKAKDLKLAEEKAAKVAAIQAPDVEKLGLYAADIRTLVESAPVMQVSETDDILQTAIVSLENTIQYIESKSEELK